MSLKFEPHYHYSDTSNRSPSTFINNPSFENVEFYNSDKFLSLIDISLPKIRMINENNNLILYN